MAVTNCDKKISHARDVTGFIPHEKRKAIFVLDYFWKGMETYCDLVSLGTKFSVHYCWQGI